MPNEPDMKSEEGGDGELDNLEPVVSCEVCLKEIPRSVAQKRESEDYVLYFCGLDCYEKWKLMNGER
jgi:hypothetical protein